MKCPDIAELPLPPPGRTGWPWTEGAPPCSSESGRPWPRITVVTPSLGQGAFIEETIRSVLLQGYPDLEYFVLDGGSTDGTKTILERYAPWLAGWESGPDGGQAQAINKGFGRSSGELLAWQNADDTYWPGALLAAGAAAAADPGCDVIYGDKDYVAEDGSFLHTAWSRPPTAENMIPWPCVHSEVTFFRRRAFEGAGMLDESFRHYLDYELFWRLVLAGKRFRHVPNIRATFRQHAAAKSSRQGEIAQAEAFEIYRRVHARPELTTLVRRKLEAAMRDECANDWGSYRFNLLRRHVRELIATAGSRSLKPKLMAMVLSSYIGESAVRKLKGVSRWLSFRARN